MCFELDFNSINIVLGITQGKEVRNETFVQMQTELPKRTRGGELHWLKQMSKKVSLLMTLFVVSNVLFLKVVH